MATEVRRRFDDVPLLPEGAVDLGQLLPGAGEIELDVGFGKGGFVLSRALGDPGRRVLGIEVRKKYVALVRDRLLVAQASNARVFCGDARYVLPRMQPDGSLARVLVHFPDPWWKKRHDKRRLIDRAFVAQVARLLRPAGELFVQTDVEERAQLYAALIDEGGWFAGGRVEASPYDAQSTRERRCVAEGVPVYRLLYRRLDERRLPR